MEDVIYKVCTVCGVEKPIKDFNKRCIGKHKSECKLCENARCRAYKKTKEGLIAGIYVHQKLSSKRRKHALPAYSLSELRTWAFSQPKFHSLFLAWEKSGYNKKYVPSFDRKNDYESYKLSNLNIMTWEDNKLKAHSDMVNGINNKQNHAVRGIRKESGEVFEFHSIQDAGRKTQAAFQNIYHCLHGRRNYAGGYKWELIKN
ncbi:hypothetical protein KKC59_04945 [bacterium]|nr:hypothetical protein [bacterium]MBU1613601.1 hypothetical protein [Patescibacteria group bacterium]